MSGLNFSEVVPPRCSGLHGGSIGIPAIGGGTLTQGRHRPSRVLAAAGKIAGFPALFLIDTVYFKSYSQSDVQK